MVKGKRGARPEGAGATGTTVGDEAEGFTSGAENTNIRRPTLVEEGARAAAARGASKRGGTTRKASGGANGAGAGKEAPDDPSGASSAIAAMDETQPLAGADDESRIEVTSAEVGDGAGGKKTGGGRKRATQPDLIEDMRIPELHEAALDYVGKRDARIDAGRLEKDAKDLLLAQMKKHEKEVYQADGLTCRIVHEKENIKVEVNKGDDNE